MTRGLRNNNPANIRRGSSWRGLSAVQRDKEFCQFCSLDFGIRAFFVLMRTYNYKYKCHTITQILHKFAPNSENDTSAYISFVVKYLNDNQSFLNSDVKRIFVDNSVVNAWYNRSTPCMELRLFAKAVFMMESNFKVTDEQINKALALL